MRVIDLRRDSDDEREQCEECHDALADFEATIGELDTGSFSEIYCTPCLRKMLNQIKADMRPSKLER